MYGFDWDIRFRAGYFRDEPLSVALIRLCVVTSFS